MASPISILWDIQSIGDFIYWSFNLLNFHLLYCANGSDKGDHISNDGTTSQTAMVYSEGTKKPTHQEHHTAVIVHIAKKGEHKTINSVVH